MARDADLRTVVCTTCAALRSLATITQVFDAALAPADGGGGLGLPPATPGRLPRHSGCSGFEPGRDAVWEEEMGHGRCCACQELSVWRHEQAGREKGG
eukprot:7034894-Prymnesium_polylepis.1